MINTINLNSENIVKARTQPTQEMIINKSIDFFIILYYTKDTRSGEFPPRSFTVSVFVCETFSERFSFCLVLSVRLNWLLQLHLTILSRQIRLCLLYSFFSPPSLLLYYITQWVMSQVFFWKNQKNW